ncbi:MAG: hypothetical protein KIT83_04065 [Bryobacterales bacterium]|nr:hypothetical protein [Bryobacterales bacterium]
MRAPRSLSLPLAIAVTCGVWYCFLWTMQHAPVSRSRGGGDFGGARSQGGLANPFASAVVRFFDEQDPRTVADDSPVTELKFSGQIPDLLPFPDESRETIAQELPELYSNPSLSSRNLFRSDVDLDGDGHLDMALLIRLSRDRALGVVLAYTPKQRFRLSGSFRMAGKFACDLAEAQDFERCFQVMRTGSGAIHIASYSLLPPRENEGDPLPLDGNAGWRMMRLEEGDLRETGRILETCPGQIRNLVQPVGEVDEDLLLHTLACPERRCRVWRYAERGTGWTEAANAAEHCEEDPPSQ